jgi:hypothetical protein
VSPQEARVLAMALMLREPAAAKEAPGTSDDNVVELRPRVNPEALTEFEARARQHFMEGTLLALDATWKETKQLNLGQATATQLAGIMHRALDDCASAGCDPTLRPPARGAAYL